MTMNIRGMISEVRVVLFSNNECRYIYDGIGIYSL